MLSICTDTASGEGNVRLVKLVHRLQPKGWFCGGGVTRVGQRLRIICAQCGKVLVVPAEAVGRKGTCPGCKHRMTIEANDAVPVTPQQEAPLMPARLAEQPSHRAELNRDKQRVLSAVATAPDKYALVAPYLMEYEQPVALAVQRQFPFSLFADIVVLSSHRLLVFRRFFTKIDMLDVNYVDLDDVRIRQGFFTSEMTIVTAANYSIKVPRLVTDQALTIYRHCQDIETKARIARRQFALEENRSRTNQMQINNLVTPQHPSQFLGNRDIAQIGEEERNPFRLGE